MFHDHMEDPFNERPMPDARSRAEVRALKQRKIQITLTAISVILTALTALRVFGIL